MKKLTSIELCAGAGGQALGLHLAGFSHRLLIDNDASACKTLQLNNFKHNLGWGSVIEGCLKEFSNGDLSQYVGTDLVAGGVPCPPFSKAGKQLGRDDERDLFPAAIRVVEKIKPKAVMLENVSGLLEPKFSAYREEIDFQLVSMGYVPRWKLINASDYGVSQLRPRVILVALEARYADYFAWPEPLGNPLTVGELLFDLMAKDGWPGARDWAENADSIAPTLVGGSKKHGGPDLGPTRAKAAWKALGVNGHRVADTCPSSSFVGEKEGYENMPLLTVRMAARIQGFPDWWEFYGKKTAAYRQVGNAFPAPVSEAVGTAIKLAIEKGSN